MQGRILRLLLASMEHEDMLVLRGEPSGEFSVRSGYKLLLDSTTDPIIELQNDMINF